MHDSSTCRSIWNRRSPSELGQIAHIKRFLERWAGDRRFRAALDIAEDPRTVATAYDLKVDPRSISTLFEVPQPSRDEPASPAVELWRDYHRDLTASREAARRRGDCAVHNPRFHAWRQRQIRRADGECGPNPTAIVHPVVAFELSEGCSVGCWFCGISAASFRGFWPYSTANSRLFREVLEILSDILGPAVRSGFLYWATDPLDNPDYPRFLEDFATTTGYLPQTTTAIPLRDVALTRRVMALFDDYQHVVNRFSILTPKILDRVHRTFSPEELLGVELVPQMSGSVVSKTPAGRARKRHLTARESGAVPFDPARESTTIACVSGFLISLMRGTIQLISPTRPSTRWPDGYKTWPTRRFATAASFRDAIESSLKEDVVTAPQPHHPVAFRSDLRFRPAAEGFTLASSTVLHRIAGGSFMSELGRLIASGRETHRSLRQRMLASGANLLSLEAALGKVYDAGLLQEPIDFVPQGEGDTDTPDGGAPLTRIGRP